MVSRPRTALACCLAAISVALACAPAAFASHGETVFFEAPSQLLSPAQRPLAITQMQSLGAHAVRILLYWNQVAPSPNARTKPAGFTATDPADYNWGQYVPLIAEMQTLGWKVLLTVTGPVPCWASTASKCVKGDQVTDPNEAAYGQFMQAVGAQFGTYVKLYSIWNEPNQPQFLEPQYQKAKIVSATIYRQLYLDGYAGLKASGNFSGMQVLMGETSPIGGSIANIPPPLAFLRGVLCLNARYVKTQHCAKLQTAGYAMHPYTEADLGLFWTPPSSDDVTIATLGRLVTALNRAAAAGAIPSGTPVYITEYGVPSKPNPLIGVSVAQQAEYVAISERIAWDNPRVASYDQYLLTDDPPYGGNLVEKWSGFQTGLDYANGQQKPSFNGWRLPLTVTRRGAKVAFWGLVRPATAATSVLLQYSGNGGRAWHSLLSAQTGASGYWTASGRFVKGRVWRVQWTSPSGTVYVGPTIRAYTATGTLQPASR